MRTTFAMMAILMVAACGDPNQLWGSIRESYPMEFDRVEVVRQGHALRIEYIRDHGQDQEWVCKLTLDTEGLELTDNAEIRAKSFTDRVAVERNAGEEDEPLPRYTGGLLHFDEYALAAGDPVNGDFNVLFDNGRNLAGSFATTLAVAYAGRLVPQSEDNGEVPLSLPPDEEDEPVLGDGTVVARSCAACPPHGLLVAVWILRRLVRRRRLRL